MAPKPGAQNTAKFQASISRLAEVEAELRKATKDLDTIIEEGAIPQPTVSNLANGGPEALEPSDNRGSSTDSRIQLLAAIDNVLAGPGSVKEKAQLVAEELARITPAEWVVLRIRDDAREGLSLIAEAGHDIAEHPSIPLVPYNRGLVGRVLAEGVGIVSNTYHSHPDAIIYRSGKGPSSAAAGRSLLVTV